MIFNYNQGPGGRYELRRVVISRYIYTIDYFTITLIQSQFMQLFGIHLVIYRRGVILSNKAYRVYDKLYWVHTAKKKLTKGGRKFQNLKS
jgi:hypothetical protein